MSASSKCELSSASPDRALYGSGLRGSNGVASLDRSGSFRENMENPLLSSLPNTTRSSSSATPGDVLNFFQCVRFNPKSMVVDHKLNRPAAFKRLASASVGIPLEDSLPASSKSKQLSSSSADDLRRLKAGVRESGTKARERVKILNDCLSVINKCFPTIPSRKRSRLDALSNDRPYAVLPIDRSVAAMGTNKMGTQSHASTSAPEPEMQKCEDRSKNAILNKRPRTSMTDSKMDVRVNAPSRPSGTLIKDRDVVRLANGGVVQEEERTLSIAVDSLKPKMKKKRTGIKPDIVASSMVTKPVDGYRESKQGLQLRILTEARSRLTVFHGFRTGISNGGVSAAKAEATSQTSSGMRSSVSRTDSENSSLLQERRERPGAQEKERVNLEVADKANSREDLSSGSPTSGSKLNVNIRAPRSSSVGGVSKLSQVAQRSSPCDDWELSNCTGKLPGPLAANNRKRTPSARSSSPPVGSWVQRPRKISRTARRPNLLPNFPANDENVALDTSSNMPVNERHSPQQVRIRNDNFSPATLSESEESGAIEIKLSDKSKKFDKIEEKSGQNVQKMSTLLPPPRKKKTVSRDDHEDGIRRQGRSGRGFSSSRSLLPLTTEKLGNVGTIKQVRSSRLGLDKIESKAGRPPTKKLSDRKANTRQKHVAVNMTSDFLVGSDIGREDLLAAANAVTNTAQAISSPFWKVMESLFRFISDKDISYLKDQMNLGSAVDTLVPAPLDANCSTLSPNECGLNEFGSEDSEVRSVELSSEYLTPGAKAPNEISLYQRLMSAIIPEEGFAWKENKYKNYGSQLEIETDVDGDTFFTGMPQSSDLSGFGSSANGNLFYELDHTMLDTSIKSIPDPGIIPSDRLQNSVLGHQVIPCADYLYHNMSMNEKLLLEINSIGIYPDLGTGDDEIDRNISTLDLKYQEKVSKKKSLLGNLLSSASEAKEHQEKEFEGLALENLVGMAYEKYMSCRRPNAHGIKSFSGKMAKQAALGFVKRVLEQYQEFEMTGKSCFDEPLYKDLFLSRVSNLVEGPINLNTDNESGKLRRSASGCFTEVRTPAPVGTQQSPSNMMDMYSSEVLSDNLVPGQNTGKEESWSNRVKRKELLLDDVGGMMSTSPGVPSSLGASLSCSAKGKRSGRDREGKGNSRQVSSRSGTGKIGRPASASVKGERKSKAKPKQKNVNLSASVALGKMSGQTKGMISSTLKSSNFGGSDVDMLEEPIDLSGLQIPEIGDLGVPDDLGGQGEDIGSWLNIEDDGLQDYVGGLEIPMDDLSDLNMMV